MGSREEPCWLQEVKGAEQGDAHVWEQEENWLFHKCPELLGIMVFKSCLALGLDFPPHFTKLEKKDEEKRHFFPLDMKKSDTQKDHCIFFHFCLSFKSGETEMDTEDTKCATKKDASLGKIQT